MDQRPIFTDDGYTFAYIKVRHAYAYKIMTLLLEQHNNLFLMCVTKRNSNIALVLMTLYRLVNVSSCLCLTSRQYD
jgi:AP-1 complex subunit mu